MFSIAKKLKPCIIFVDEMDSVLRSRGSIYEHEVTLRTRAIFMQQWEGLSDSNSEVVVFGTTNRPNDLDPAVLRRLQYQFEIPMPDLISRKDILKRILKGENVSKDLDYDELSKITDRYSGSDLRFLCQTAARIPVMEFIDNELVEKKTVEEKKNC